LKCLKNELTEEFLEGSYKAQANPICN